MILRTPVNDTGRTAWCGPTALAVITGEPLSRFPVDRHGGMSAGTLKYHLRMLGYGFQTTVFPRGKGPKMAVALPVHEYGFISAGRHWLAFSGKLVRDTMVDRATWAFDHPWARRRARMIIVVTWLGPTGRAR